MMQTFSFALPRAALLYRTRAVCTDDPYAGCFRLRQPAGDVPLKRTWTSWRRRSESTRRSSSLRLKNTNTQARITPAGHAVQVLQLPGLLRVAASRRRLPGQAPQRPGALERRQPDQARDRRAPDAARRRRRPRFYPSDGCGTILKIDDFAHVAPGYRRIGNRPRLGNGAGAVGVRGTRAAAFGFPTINILLIF